MVLRWGFSPPRPDADRRLDELFQGSSTCPGAKNDVDEESSSGRDETALAGSLEKRGLGDNVDGRRLEEGCAALALACGSGRGYAVIDGALNIPS
jgi:hypothetical protein